MAVLLLVFALLSVAFGQQTLCEKYAKALGLTQIAMMQKIVGDVVTAELASASIKPFFDGRLPTGSTDFTSPSNKAAFDKLALGLVSFFGGALGCSEAGFPKYTGAAMGPVHANMPIGRAEFDLFNDIFITTIGKLGVVAADQATIRSLLDSFASQIVNPKTICPKYAKALGVTQIKLMNDIVGKVVTAEVSNPQILPFFNGVSPPGSRNIVGSPAEVTRLSAGLVSFFGGALGCTETGFPKYTGADMKTIHAKMPIGRKEFDLFNNIFNTTVAGLGVDRPDQLTIKSILDSFAPQIVNPTTICPKYAKALGVSQIKLMTDIVTAVVGAEVADPVILTFFNGVAPPGSKNIVGSTAEVNRVAGGLIAFFGGALGCTETGFPKYTGPDMKTVHARMPISMVEYNKFNDIFIATLAKIGVEVEDRTTVRFILDSFAPQIVNPTFICPKYAKALGVTQIKLMTDIVTAVVGAEVADPVILPFFNGVSPPGSKNIVGSTAEVNRVAGGLIAFFGGALGCTETGFPKYTGADMKTVHARMPISMVEYNKFNDIFIATLAKIGVVPEDRTLIRTILDSFATQIVNPTYVCPKYAKALGVTQIKLMTDIVTAVVNKEVADPELKLFFNGVSPPGSKNILASTAEVNRVAGGLVAFFGGALGCTETGFPKYTGAAMKPVHQNMPITVALFNKFNNIFIDTLAGLGVVTDDRTLIRSLLDSTQKDIVQGPITPGPPVTPGTGGDGDLVGKGYTFSQPLGCDITAYWMPVDTGAAPADQVVKFAVRRKTTGWVALGFPANDAFQMIGSDAVIGWVSGAGSISVNPYRLTGKSVDAILANDKMPITEASAVEVDGVTTIFFTRKLKSGYNPITDLSSVTVIASSHDDADNLIQHTCRVPMATILDLETGSGAAGSGQNQSLRNAHGSLMILGWGAFLTIGVLVARYGRGSLSNGLWFKVHQILQIVGMSMTTAGFVIALVMVEGAHFNTSFHGQLGVAIMALAYIQMLGGILRPHKEEGSEASGLRKVFEVLHPNIGRLLLILAVINIFAGIQQQWHFWVHILYGITVGFFLLVIIGGELSGAAKGGDSSSSSPDYYAMT